MERGGEPVVPHRGPGDGYLADGNLEFMGRADDQVKIRGFGSSLGEIEAALLEHPDVRQAVVAARGGMAGEKQLVAYCVCGRGGAPERRKICAGICWGHPAPVHGAGGFRLSGRTAAEPEREGGSQGAACAGAERAMERRYEAPRTPTEEMLAQIWAEVLGLDRVGVDDNFFVLGGHSLLATQVMARVRESLGVEVPVRALFEASATVRELAEQVEPSGVDEQGLQAPPLLSGRAGPAASVPGAGAAVVSGAAGAAGQRLQRNHGGWSWRGRWTRRPWSAASRRWCAARSLRTRIETTVVGQGRQVIDPAGGFRLRVVDPRGGGQAQRGGAARQAQAEARRPFDLGSELFRVSLFRLSAEEHMPGGHAAPHHLRCVVAAGVSAARVECALRGVSKGKPPSPLPELEAQYADYALWQREWLQGEIWSGRWPTGASNCGGCPRRWNCRPTSRARRCPVIKGRGIGFALQEI